ncbi:MAG: hypothetical protein LBB22_00850 [Treponema sp.]|jgi:hypothetical protein|nr:hypothetical protein [Treponema sp.]
MIPKKEKTHSSKQAPLDKKKRGDKFPVKSYLAEEKRGHKNPHPPGDKPE